MSDKDEIAKAVARELRYWVQMHRPWRVPDDPSAPTAQAAHWRDAKMLEMRADELDPHGEWPSIAYPAKPPTEVSNP